jgi:hypothetical protein
MRLLAPPTLAAVGLLSSIAAWLAGGELPVGRRRNTAGLGHPVHADCDPADQRTRSIAKWGVARNAESIPQWFDFRPTENASTRQMC